MLRAVLEDFRQLSDVETLTLIDAWQEKSEFRALVRDADWSLIIAPETGGVLANRCRWVVEENSRLLGPSVETVELCSDKLALAQFWLRAGVQTPETMPWKQSRTPTEWVEQVLFPPEKNGESFFAPSPPAKPGGEGARSLTQQFETYGVVGRVGNASFDAPAKPTSVVIKPRDGAGCESMKRLSWNDLVSRDNETIKGSDSVIQPWIPGIAASVAFLVGPQAVLSLPPALQHIVEDESGLHYAGGSLPLPAELTARAERIAREAVAAVPGLAGYVGVDVVLGDDGRDWAIEINPRLTTSYVGLRQLCCGNLMAALVNVMSGEVPELSWNDERVSFTCDGRITRSASKTSRRG